MPIVAIGTSLPVTQKAKGVKALIADPAEPTPAVQPYQVLLVQAPLTDAMLAGVHLVQGYQTFPLTFPLFARPCPLTPRPGFVDSRVVKTQAEVMQAWEETRRADPKGEMLLMPFIEAKWNICVSPGHLTIGPGNDGATAGKKGCATFPINPQQPAFYDELCKVSSITDALHLEAVVKAEGNFLCLVQARNGPLLPSSSSVDFIPSQVVVKRVIRPLDDLLEWEAKVKELTTGDVVYSGTHTLGSHAALHCIGKGIPFITSARPKVGDVLIPPKGMPKADMDALRRGIAWGLSTAINGKSLSEPPWNSHPERLRQMSMMILYGLHHYPALVEEHTFWIGAAGAVMLRIGLACGQGESHSEAPGCPCQGYHGELLNADSLTWTAKSLAFLPKMHQGFYINGMSSDGVPQLSGIGGHNWGRCVFSLFALNRALRACCRKSARERDLLALLVALNKAVDQAHNGAWWLNRYGVGPGDFKEATDGSWRCAMEAASLMIGVKRPTAAETSKVLEWYLGLGCVKPSTFPCTATINDAGNLKISYTARINTLNPKKLSSVVPPGTKLTQRRRMRASCFCIDFITPQGEVIWTEEFEQEKDPRKPIKQMVVAPKPVSLIMAEGMAAASSAGGI